MNLRVLFPIGAVTTLLVVAVESVSAPSFGLAVGAALVGPNGLPLTDSTWLALGVGVPAFVTFASSGHGRDVLAVRLVRYGSVARWLRRDLTRDWLSLMIIVGAWVVVICAAGYVSGALVDGSPRFWWQLFVNFPLQMSLSVIMCFGISRSRGALLTRIAALATFGVVSAIPLRVWPWNPFTGGALGRVGDDGDQFAMSIGLGALVLVALLTLFVFPHFHFESTFKKGTGSRHG